MQRASADPSNQLEIIPVHTQSLITAAEFCFSVHANERFRCREITQAEAVDALGTEPLVDHKGFITIPTIVERPAEPGIPARIGRQFVRDGNTRFVVLAFTSDNRPIHLVLGTRGRPTIATVWDPSDPECRWIWRDGFTLPTTQGRYELPPTTWDLDRYARAA